MARIVLGGLTTLNTSTHLDPMTSDLYGVADYFKSPAYTGASWKLAVDSVGNFATGGVSVSAWGSAIKALEVGTMGVLYSSAGGDIGVGNNWFYNGSAQFIYKSTAAATQYQQIAGTHRWFSAASGTAGNPITFAQTAMLNASGALLVNTTVQGYQNANCQSLEGAQGYGALNHASGTAGGTLYLGFGYNGGSIGSITQSGTTAVLYNTTSDRRLKTEIEDLPGAPALVQAIQWRRYEFKSEPGTKIAGVIADELQQVYPPAVTGEPNEMERWPIYDDNGLPIGWRVVDKMQQVDYSKLVPILGAALKAALADIDALRARVAALEVA